MVALLWSLFQQALVKIGTLLDAFFLEGSGYQAGILLSDAAGLVQ